MAHFLWRRNFQNIEEGGIRELFESKYGEQQRHGIMTLTESWPNIIQSNVLYSVFQVNVYELY